MGLTWDCVGFEGKKIRIAGGRTMAGKDVVTKDPKTSTSVRGCVDPNSVPGFGIFALTLIAPADLPEGKAGRPLP